MVERHVHPPFFDESIEEARPKETDSHDEPQDVFAVKIAH